MTLSTATLELEVITAALKEQFARNADTATVIETLVSLSGVIARRAPDATVRAAADGLKVRALKLSQANEVPQFVVRDLIHDFIQQLESRPHRTRV